MYMLMNTFIYLYIKKYISVYCFYISIYLFKYNLTLAGVAHVNTSELLMRRSELSWSRGQEKRVDLESGQHRLWSSMFWKAGTF